MERNRSPGPRRDGTVALNLAALDDKLREQGLKQWWLAEQIGVNPKTVNRWLTGQVRRVRRDSLDRVAQELGCRIESLIDDDPQFHAATDDERVEAARLIESENLLEILAPAGRWPLLEGLIKATLRSDLPLSLLGRLYTQLSIAAWRQSHLQRAEDYARRSIDCAQRARHRAVLAEATLNRATLAAFRGRLPEAMDLYRECIAAQVYFDEPSAVGKAYSNLGFTALEYGDPDAAEHWQNLAVAIFAAADKPFNLAIAQIGLALVFIERREFDAAASALDDAAKTSKVAKYLRAEADVPLLRAILHAERGSLEEARSALESAVKRYEELGIDEARTYRVRAQVARLSGDFKQATMLLEKGRKMANDFPVERAEIIEEEIKVSAVCKDDERVAALIVELRALFDEIGAEPRLASLVRSTRRI